MELANDGDGCNLDRIGQLFTDLVMWNDVAKSSLWFGFGSLCFISSCFTQGIKFRWVELFSLYDTQSVVIWFSFDLTLTISEYLSLLWLQHFLIYISVGPFVFGHFILLELNLSKVDFTAFFVLAFLSRQIYTILLIIWSSKIFAGITFWSVILRWKKTTYWEQQE